MLSEASEIESSLNRYSLSRKQREPTVTCRAVCLARARSLGCGQNRGHANPGMPAEDADLSKTARSLGNGSKSVNFHVSVRHVRQKIRRVYSMRQLGQSRRTGLTHEWRNFFERALRTHFPPQLTSLFHPHCYQSSQKLVIATEMGPGSPC